MSGHALQPGRVAWAPVGAAAFVLAIVGYGLLGPALPRPTPTPPTRIVDARSLVFRAEPGDALLAADAGTGQVVARIAPGGDGFMRGVLHGIDVLRHRLGVRADAPLMLERSADGRLVLADTGTRTLIDLEAFGPVNEAAFARLLHRASDPGRG